MTKGRWEFRDVSLGLQVLRNFLLGRKHTLHGRFLPTLAPRSIPPPDIPRGPVHKYSNNGYYSRDAMNSVLPPVVAPVAQGPPIDQDPTKKSTPGGLKPDSICFSCMPTPGPTWWWDGHCNYECVPDPGETTCPTPECPPCPPPSDENKT